MPVARGDERPLSDARRQLGAPLKRPAIFGNNTLQISYNTLQIS
jgi:hypothetical protein